MKQHIFSILLAATAVLPASAVDLKKTEQAFVHRDAMILEGAIHDWTNFLKEAPSAAREKYSAELVRIKQETEQAKTMEAFRPLELRFDAWKKNVMSEMFGATNKEADPFLLFSQAQVEAYAILGQARKTALKKDDLRSIDKLQQELGAAADAETLGRIFDRMGRYSNAIPAAVADNTFVYVRPLPQYSAMSAFGSGRGLKTAEVPSPLQKADRDPFAQVEQALLERGFKKNVIDIIINEAIRQKADPLLVLAVVIQESNGSTKATSKCGARGLMQIMPATGRGLGVANPNDLYDAQTNVEAGVRYLNQLWDRFAEISMAELAAVNPFSRIDVKMAIAAYNAGPGNVAKYDGVPPFKQTIEYVNKVIGYYNELRELYT